MTTAARGCVVVAVGGNALSRPGERGTAGEQTAHLRETVAALEPLLDGLLLVDPDPLLDGLLLDEPPMEPVLESRLEPLEPVLLPPL